MQQLQLDIPDEIAVIIQQKAKVQGISVSQYIKELIKKDTNSRWPENFFTNVIGGWKGEPLKRPIQGEFEKRDEL